MKHKFDEICGLSDAKLVQLAISGTRNPVPGNDGRPRWSLVGDLFGLGSTSSSALCTKFSIDPDEILKGPPNCAACGREDFSEE